MPTFRWPHRDEMSGLIRGMETPFLLKQGGQANGFPKI